MAMILKSELALDSSDFERGMERARRSASDFASGTNAITKSSKAAGDSLSHFEGYAKEAQKSSSQLSRSLNELTKTKIIPEIKTAPNAVCHGTPMPLTTAKVK